jgi:hypothetical protein
MKSLFKPVFSKKEKSTDYSRCAGIHVQTGIQAGAWRCTNCAGQANGSDLIKPKCDYCEIA